METWKPVTADPFSSYDVSDLGRIRNSGGYVLNPAVARDGYRTVSLSHGVVRKTFRVHRLVAVAFVPGDTNLHVDHIDGNTTNACAYNLRWCTAAENNCFSRQAQRWDPFMHVRNNKILTEEIVLGIRFLAKEFPGSTTIWQLADCFGVSFNCVHAIVHGRTWKHLPCSPPPLFTRGRKRKA